jgi:hypothetical protein
MADNLANIEQRTDMVKAAAVQIGTTLGGVTINTVNDVDVMALRLSRGEVAVPVHCRGKMGVCHALILQALEWRMPIMSVINKSYVVSNKGVERIAYESQMIHAIIERNAPIKGRMRYEIGHLVNGVWEKGGEEDDDRRCKVWATFHGETQPHDYTSQPLGKLRDARGRNEQGNVKGSPLWDKDPEVQLFYSASRQWARNYCPDVILGAYTPEDPYYADAMAATDVTPVADKVAAYAQKLKDAKATHVRGFDADHVTREASMRSSHIIEGDIIKEDPDGRTEERKDAPDPERGPDAPARGPDDNRDQGGSGNLHSAGSAVRSQPAGEQAAPAQGEGQEDNIFPPDRKSPKGKR